MVKKKSVSRKDFEVFARGVERLEELRKELDKLDTRRFPVETASIRSKLKNVSYIPEIERELRILKAKIKGSYHVKKRKTPDVHLKIHKRIKELEKKIESKKGVSGVDRKYVKDIPKIENELRGLKNFMREQRDEEKRKEELLKKIDPSVNIIVDDKFNLTLEEIKAELSKKLKEKESEVKRELQDDLESRKRNFDIQYKLLEDKFHKKYEARVKKALRREVKRSFKKKLNEAITGVKGKVTRKTKDEVVKMIQDEFDSKKKDVQKEYAKRLEKEKQGMKRHFEEEVLAKRVQLNHKMHEHLTSEVKKMDREKEEEVKKKVENQSKIIKDKLRKEFDNQLKLELQKKQVEFDKKKAQLNMELQNKMKQMLS